MSIPQPLPRIREFEKMGFGMFIHWGLYSQLGAGEWTQDSRAIPFAEYKKLAETFTAEDFDPDAIAALAANTGMKYIVLTTRHHDGFSLYDTCGLNDFDAPHTPAGRDLIAEFVEACRRHGIVPFFYHTTLDWNWRGKNSIKDETVFSPYTRVCSEEEFQEYLDYLCASVELLCKNYGKIGGLWFDGNWSRPQSDWQESRLYGMIRKHQPDAIIVNNTGLVALGKTGHPEIDSVTYENNAAKPMNREGNLILNEAEKDNPHMKELEDQFKLFTLSLKYPADGPDAVEGANRIIDKTLRNAEPPATQSRKTVRSRNKHRL